MTDALWLGADIGGTKIAVAAVQDAKVGRVLTAPTPEGPDEIVNTVVRLARHCLDGGELRGLGVGSAGTFDSTGTVTHATDLLPGWTGTPLADLLGTILDAPVVAVNDVHAAAVAEARRGAGAGAARLLMVAVGTGVGGAITIDGRVDPGSTGHAGALGHIPSTLAGDRRCSCGRTGHLEAVASGPAMQRAFHAATGIPATLPEIATLAGEGDDRAAAVIETGGRALGEGFAAGAALIDPDVIVIGGGVAQLGEQLLDPVRRAFRRATTPALAEIPLRLAEFGSAAAIVGGAVLVEEAVGSG